MKKSSPSQPKKKLSDSNYFQYTNLIYQLIGIIAFGVLAGYGADKLFHFSFPVFKLVFSFGSVIVAIYIVFKQLMKRK